MKKIEKIINKFPKERSELPVQYQRIYENEYKENRSGVGFIGKIKEKLENWMHIKVASLPKNQILEIGAGTLNHIQFEEKYTLYDAIEPMSFLYENSKFIKNTNQIYKSSEDLKKNMKYDNIISIAVFEHLTELPSELIRLINHLNQTGTMQIAIPTEGSLLWYLSWRIVTGSSFYLKYKLDYKPFMKHEHVNNTYEIETLVKYLFSDVKIVRFPFNLFHLSFYTYIEARSINYDALIKIKNFYESK